MESYYGEQRYDGIEERYDLMEGPCRCSPLTDLERSTLRPVLQAVRRTYDLVHSPIWSALDRHVTARYTMQPAWYWADDHGFVDQDDEAGPLVRYSLPDFDDRFFDPAWCYYPDWVVLAAIDTYRVVLGAAPDLAWEGCREVALASGPWWPFADVAVMSERPTLLRLNAQGNFTPTRDLRSRGRTASRCGREMARSPRHIRN